MPKKDVIQFSDVSFYRGEKRILGPLDFTLDGPRIGIVGRNGSGKSTLARLMNGLVKPDSGEISVCGVDVAADRGGAVSTVGMIFQNPDHQIIFPTVEEEIAFGLEQKGHSKKDARGAARALLHRHGRDHWAGRPTQALSQGQRHFLCLLSILAMEPRVLVLDEPYAGLDIPTSMQLHRWLEQLEQRVVLITHDPRVLAGFDQVLWLDQGRAQGLGAAGPVLEAFQTHMEKLGGVDAGTDISG